MRELEELQLDDGKCKENGHQNIANYLEFWLSVFTVMDSCDHNTIKAVHQSLVLKCACPNEI